MKNATHLIKRMSLRKAAILSGKASFPHKRKDSKRSPSKKQLSAIIRYKKKKEFYHTYNIYAEQNRELTEFYARRF